MSDHSPYRNARGGLAVGSLVTSFIAIVMHAGLLENIKTIGLVFGGFADVLNGIDRFFRTGITLSFLTGENLLGGAFVAHQEWIRTLGVLAPIASTLEIALLVWLLLGFTKAILSVLGGAFG